MASQIKFKDKVHEKGFKDYMARSKVQDWDKEEHISKTKMEILQKKQEISEQNLRIKKLKSLFELESLNKWIIKNLNEDELISFFISKKHIEKIKVTVTKKQDLYNISLGTKNIREFFTDELFSNFVTICGMANLREISVYQIMLYRENKDEFVEHYSISDGDLW